MILYHIISLYIAFYNTFYMGAPLEGSVFLFLITLLVILCTQMYMICTLYCTYSYSETVLLLSI